MSEVTFAKAYLATLDKRAIKIPADQASDPRKYPTQSPYILPKQTNPFPQHTGPTSTQQAKAKTINVTLKPMRSGDAVALSDITLDTTIHDIKTQYAQRTGQQQDKIKLLLNKKPTADLKTLKDLGVEKDAELSVMIMGGGTTPSATTPVVEKAASEAVPSLPPSEPMDVDAQASAPPSEKAQMEIDTAPITAEGILKTDEFWTDLKGFLAQRLRDQKEGERLAGVFREAMKVS